MCMCTYVHVLTCVRVCMNVCGCVHECMRVCAWMEARIYVHVCTCLDMHMSAFVCMYALIVDVRGLGHHTCVRCTIVSHSAIIIGLTCN